MSEKNLEEKVDEILQNHLPHIGERLAGLEAKTKILLTLATGILIAVIGIIIKI